VNWAADYAAAFGTTASNDATADTAETTSDSAACSGVGLSLIAGLALMGLMMVKLEE
jgi:hypothetical protein